MPPEGGRWLCRICNLELVESAYDGVWDRDQWVGNLHHVVTHISQANDLVKEWHSPQPFIQQVAATMAGAMQSSDDGLGG